MDDLHGLIARGVVQCEKMTVGRAAQRVAVARPPLTRDVQGYFGKATYEILTPDAELQAEWFTPVTKVTFDQVRHAFSPPLSFMC